MGHSTFDLNRQLPENMEKLLFISSINKKLSMLEVWSKKNNAIINS